MIVICVCRWLKSVFPNHLSSLTVIFPEGTLTQFSRATSETSDVIGLINQHNMFSYGFGLRTADEVSI